MALRAPPPLDTELAPERREDGSVALLDDGRVVLEARPATVEGDGLRLFAGPVADRDVFATAWTPAYEFGDAAVDPLFVWAALDCPSSAPTMSGKTIVLASLAAALRRPVAIGEPHVIGSWRIGAEGRKHWNGVVLWDAEGGVCAVGRALWIELRESK